MNLKRKAPRLSDLPFVMKNYRPETAKRSILEHYNGGGTKEPVYNSSGCKALVDAVLLKTYPTDPFTLYIKLGEHWYPVTTVHGHDPGIQQIVVEGQMVNYGLSPDEQKRKDEREKAREAFEDECRVSQLARVARFIAKNAEWLQKRKKAIQH